VLKGVLDDGERFWLPTGPGEAELVYNLDGRRLVLLHTGVPGPARNQGTGGCLVNAALERAVAQQLVIVPLCSFARHWLQEHPDRAGEVDIDWDATLDAEP